MGSVDGLLVPHIISEAPAQSILNNYYSPSFLSLNSVEYCLFSPFSPRLPNVVRRSSRGGGAGKVENGSKEKLTGLLI